MILSRRKLLTFAVTAPAIASFAQPVLAATPEVYSEDGIAVDGSDVVAYFTQGAPVAGDATITHDYLGVTWRFSSTQHRDLFAADPAAYAPQYGGYCAFAVSRNYTAATVPEAWRIVDGKLYLNFSRRIQRSWERDIPGNIAAGDANWPSVLG
ncbi:MAG: YHS domain-containing (seleno)protein [Pseudomonadota bacterium]